MMLSNSLPSFTDELNGILKEAVSAEWIARKAEGPAMRAIREKQNRAASIYGLFDRGGWRGLQSSKAYKPSKTSKRIQAVIGTLERRARKGPGIAESDVSKADKLQNQVGYPLQQAEVAQHELVQSRRPVLMKTLGALGIQ